MLRCLSRLALAAALLCAGAATSAGVWVEPGDRRLRADVELMKAHGLIKGPVDSWPLPWRQLEDAVAIAERHPLPPAVSAAVDRVALLVERQRQRSRFEARASFTSEPALVRDFGDPARNAADMQVRAEHDLGLDVTFTYGVSFTSEGTDRQAITTERGNGFSLRPLQGVAVVRNLAIYAGYTEIWWGPGQDGSLLFSNSARPFPKVGVKLVDPRRIDLPVLRWLGPLRFEAFAGVMDEERDFRNTAVGGMRVEFEPTPGLTIGLSRGLQLCGEGRPCGLGTIVRAIIGLGDLDNTGTPFEPGNQLAGFDIQYRFPIGRGGDAATIYFDTIAEDEDNIIIEQFARQGGIRFAGPVGTRGASYTFGVEITDTLASTFFGPKRFPGSMYNNFIYLDGWTYQRRPIGFSLDGDTRMFTVHGSHTDLANRRWYGSFRLIDLNVTAGQLNPDFLFNRVSQSRERITMGTAGVEWPTRFGDLRFEARVQDNAPDTPGRSPLRVQGEFGWISRF